MQCTIPVKLIDISIDACALSHAKRHCPLVASLEEMVFCLMGLDAHVTENKSKK
jgi:hypothetical protein